MHLGTCCKLQVVVQAANTPSADARVEAGAALLEEGTKQLPTAAMWQVYVQHLHTALVGLQVKPA